MKTNKDKRKRIKCEKCGIYFREKNWAEPEIYKHLCFNCTFIWKVIGSTIEGLSRLLREKGIKRRVELNIKDLKIIKD